MKGRRQRYTKLYGVNDHADFQSAKEPPFEGKRAPREEAALKALKYSLRSFPSVRAEVIFTNDLGLLYKDRLAESIRKIIKHVEL